jgi:hypothetical protein
MACAIFKFAYILLSVAVSIVILGWQDSALMASRDQQMSSSFLAQ